MREDVAYDVEIVHFALLEVTVATARVMEGVERVSPAIFREMPVIRLAEETSHLLVLLLEAGVFLLELANFDEGRWKCCYLVWGKAECCLEFCDGLLELRGSERCCGRVPGVLTCSM